MEIITINLILDLPLLAAVVIFLFPRLFPKYREEYGERAFIIPGWVALGSCLICFLLALGLAPRVLNLTAPLQVNYWWTGRPGLFHFGLRVDALSLVLLLVTSGVAAATILFSLSYLRGRVSAGHGFYGAIMLLVGAVTGVLLATDVVQFYFFWQLMLITAGALIAFWGKEAKKAALGFFIPAQVGAMILLFALLTMTSRTGDWDIYVLGKMLVTEELGFLHLIASLILIGLAITLACFPFHRWLPRVCSSTPLPVGIMIAVLVVNASGYGMIRLVFGTFAPWSIASLSLPVLIVALITQFYGVIKAMRETDLVASVAYLCISQVGFFLFALGMGLPLVPGEAVSAAILHLTAVGMAKTLLLMIAGAVILSTSLRDVGRLGGCARRLPITAGGVVICGLALVGLPPLGVFGSNWMMFSTGWGELGLCHRVITVAALIANLLILVCVAGLVKRIFLGKLPAELKVSREPASIRWAIVALGLALITGAIWPEPLLGLVRAATQLLAMKM